MKRLIFITALTLTLFLLAGASLTAQASRPGQLPQYSTPTPGADGVIWYVVQPGDSCFRVEALTGVPVAQLRSLNRLDENCTLSVGQQLKIGVGGPVAGATPTAGAEVTATPAQPSPTPSLGQAIVCVLLYEDLNGDALRQDTEVVIPNGAISVIGTSGQYSQTGKTVAGTDPVCFEKVIQGTYNISVAAPEGYNPTTQQNYTLDIKPGEQLFVDFGAQKGAQAKPETPASQPGSDNWLGIAGSVLLLAGAGLGIYAWLVYGRRPSYTLHK
jgi:murein DD-endopeptidase MepM/ murein hydrolase activator NlpD